MDRLYFPVTYITIDAEGVRIHEYYEPEESPIEIDAGSRRLIGADGFNAGGSVPLVQPR